MTQILEAMGYRAERTPDGLVLYDVEIFLSCERDGVVFSPEWVDSAVRYAKQQQADKYLIPLHIKHHERGVDVEDAGLVQITRSEWVFYKGERRRAIMANLIVTDEAAMDRLLNKKLPFRSVEMLDVDEPIIDSLALLSHQPPYLELPLLFVQSFNEVASATFELHSTPDEGPVVGSAFAGQRAAICFRAGDLSMTKTATPPKGNPRKAKPAAFGAGIETPAAPAKTSAQFESDEDSEHMESDDDPEAMEDGEGGGIDWDVACAEIASGDVPVNVMQKIWDAIDAQLQPEAEEMEGDDEPAEAVTPAGGGDRMSKREAKMFGRMQAEIRGLRSELDAGAAEKQRDADVAAAVEMFRGTPQGANFKAELEEFHKKHGPAAFEAFVDGLAKQPFLAKARRDRDAPGQQVSKVAAKFSDEGVEAVEKAESFAKEWGEAKRQHPAMKVSQEAYVEMRMAEDRGERAY